MTGAVLSAVAPVVAVLLLLRRSSARDLGLAVCLCAAVGLGLGLSSLLWWLLMQLPIRSASTLIAIDVGIWVGVAVGLLVRRRPAPVPSVKKTPRQRFTAGAAGALVVLLPIAALAITSFGTLSYVVPHGDWDAWAIWNVRARAMFLGLPTPGVDAIVLPRLEHLDYPLLLAASVSRGWAFAGGDSVGVPIGLAAIFAGLIVLVASASIPRHRTAMLGLLAPAFILASPAFVTWTTSQGADVPMSFYLLLTFVFTASAMTPPHAGEGRDRSLWIFAGLSAALAAWTKNEGLAFVLVVFLVTAIWAWRTKTIARKWLPLIGLAIGAAPVLLIVATYKLSIEPANDLVWALSLDRVNTVVTLERMTTVGRAIARELWFGGPTLIGVLPILVTFVVVTGMPGRRSAPARLTIAALGAMLFIYFGVYVMTPHDLAWHLRTSLDRVLLQLMPSTVWAGMLLAGRPEPDRPDSVIAAAAA